MAEPLTGDDPGHAGGYRLRARLGAGAMGQVYLALTPGGRQVAVKMVRAEFGGDEQFRARFRQEVAAAQQVHGLFTAQVLEADPDAARPWLATSYVPGLSLREAVARYGPLPLDTVFLLLAGIAEALQAIHAAGIIHRDLKPSNVILAEDGPRVIDFGIARAAAAPALTGGGSWVGSPGFMAPEQARAQHVTPAADVFSLGSLAVYAAAGHPPFGTGGAVTVLSRVLHEPPDLDGCPPELRPLAERCLAKDPALRPRPEHVVSACRERAASSGLTFGLSWLPAWLCAEAADGAELPGRLDVPAPAPEGTSLPDQTGPSQAGPSPSLTGASQGGSGQGGSGQGGLGLSDPGQGGPSLNGTGQTGPGQGGTGQSGPGQTGPGQGGTGQSGPGHSGPDRTPPGLGQTASPGPPAPPSAPPAPRPVRRDPRQKTKTVAAALTGAVLLLIAAGGAIALAHHDGPRARGGPAAGGLPSPGLGAGTAGSSHGTGASAAPPSSRREAASATTARLRRGTPGASPRASSAASPSPGGPTPEPTPSGRAAFGGTWAGTVSQPGWTVTSWTVQLSIPASSSQGSYSASSTGCAGTVSVQSASGSSMTALATSTTLLNPDCVLMAHVTLTLTGPAQLSMTWTPAGHRSDLGTAILTRG